MINTVLKILFLIMLCMPMACLQYYLIYEVIEDVTKNNRNNKNKFTLSKKKNNNPKVRRDWEFSNTYRIK